MLKRCVNASAMKFVLVFLALGQVAAAQRSASSGDVHWVATWASAQQVPRPSLPPRPPVAAGATSASNAAPAAAPTAPATATAPATTPSVTATVPPVLRPARSFNNQTLRMIVRASIGGEQLRVHLSNAYGTVPLTVGAAHIALRSKDSAIVAGSDRALTFNGKPSVTIPIGAEMLSDTVALTVPKLGELAVSVYVPGDSGSASTHALGLHTTWISKEGDFTAAPAFEDADKTLSWYWVSGVDVQAAAPEAATIVAFGDSITDGATSTPDTDRSWPSVLAERLGANPATANIAVVNQGISGNKVLGDGAGVSALARFDRDVLAQAGVKWLMILEGINDMNGAVRAAAAGDTPVTADSLINAMKQMIDRAHTHGIKVIGCTLTPFGNATDSVEAMRQALNQFIRTGGAFDSVVDFDQVIRDPNSERQFRQGYNNTDRLHPNDAGYKAMADAIDLSLFASKPAAAHARK
jgi:lysophospholipase L1-like esterase